MRVFFLLILGSLFQSAKSAYDLQLVNSEPLSNVMDLKMDLETYPFC